MSAKISYSECVRQTVAKAFERLDPEFTMESLEDRFLIDNGEFRGRSFRAKHHFAMWFCEMEIVQIYNNEGELVELLDLKSFNEPAPVHRRAA